MHVVAKEEAVGRDGSARGMCGPREADATKAGRPSLAGINTCSSPPSSSSPSLTSSVAGPAGRTTVYSSIARRYDDPIVIDADEP